MAVKLQKQAIATNIPLLVWVNGREVHWAHYDFGDLAEAEIRLLQIAAETCAQSLNLEFHTAKDHIVVWPKETRKNTRKRTVKTRPQSEKLALRLWAKGIDFGASQPNLDEYPDLVAESPLSSIAQLTPKQKTRVLGHQYEVKIWSHTHDHNENATCDNNSTHSCSLDNASSRVYTDRFLVLWENRGTFVDGQFTWSRWFVGAYIIQGPMVGNFHAVS